MEGAVLVGVEEVEHCAGDPGQALEVADAGGVDVDPAEALEARRQRAVPGGGVVEPRRAATEATEEVGVTDDALEHQALAIAPAAAAPRSVSQ